VAVAAAALALAISGCGSASASPANTAAGHSSPSPAATTPTATPTPVPSASASTSSSGGAAASLALTESDLPSGGPSLSQISDGLLNSVANTDQRVFANSDNTYRLEDDIILDASAAAATSDYSSIRNAAQGNVATISSQSSPSGLGSQADEFIGLDSSGRSIIAISFQEGSVIAAVLEVASTGTVDPSFAESVAEAQDQKILAAGG
jgi:hypothetical protein